MARTATALLFIGLASAAVAATARDEAAVTPVQKVIQLLNGMVEKGKKEKNDEEVAFAQYKSFCTNTANAKAEAIKQANERIELLTADIQKFGSDADQMAKEIAGHDADLSKWNNELKAATEVRDKEHIDYIATHKDYSESINALDEGVSTLKAGSHDVKQLLLVQKGVKDLLPPEGRRKIEAFLAHDSDENLAVEVAAPEAKAYEAHDSEIIDMLAKLLDKFKDERTDLEKMEQNALNAFELLSADLRAQIEAGTDARAQKSESKAKALQQKADSKSDLVDTTTTRDDDSKYLSDLDSTCKQTSADFESRQKLRAEEIAAVEKAIEILSDPSVSGAADEHLPQLLQTKTSLAQLRSVTENPTQLRVAAFLKHQGSKLDSRLLSALAVRVSDDPFKKVKKMVKDLIVKLMEEAAAEADHKGFCDTELSTNEQTRKEKTETVEILHADIDGLEASIANLHEEIVELIKAIAELDTAVAEATSVRELEKEKNTETIKDSQAAQLAVARALSVLKDFYEKAGEATALTQVEQAPPKPLFDKPYQGMGAENGGVVGMIEVIQSDFARLEADTQAAETEAQKEYDQLMTDSSVDKSQKSSDLQHKEGKKKAHERALQEKKSDLKGTQSELDAAMAYFEKLKPSCVNGGQSYEERVAQRKEEIESLQEALRILNGEDIALLQQS